MILEDQMRARIGSLVFRLGYGDWDLLTKPLSGVELRDKGSVHTHLKFRRGRLIDTSMRCHSAEGFGEKRYFLPA